MFRRAYRRTAMVVLAWQLIAPVALPAVISACMSPAAKAACCAMQRDAQACPMHAKADAEAKRCRIRCTGSDANPFALITIGGPLPTPTALAIVSDVTGVIIPSNDRISSVPQVFDPPPPRL